jgi:hypothetical protein
MDDAWQQIGDVLEANRRIRLLHLATGVSTQWYAGHLLPLTAQSAERALAFTAPVAARVTDTGSTVLQLRRESLVPPVLTSTVMRRVIRPGGRLMRSLPFDGSVRPDNLLTRINDGDVSAAPPKVVPPGVPTLDEAAGAAEPPGVPGWVLALLRRAPWLPIALLVLALLLLVLFVFLAPVGVVLAIVVAGIALLLRRWAALQLRAAVLTTAGQTPAAVDDLPRSPDFTLTEPGSSTRPRTGSADSVTATRFKDALRDSFALRIAGDEAMFRPAPVRLVLPAMTTTIVGAINPLVTIPRRGLGLITLPPWIIGQLGEVFDEVMAYPRIDLPMYAPLKGISVELFLPNIDLIAQNSITLIETNQRFIEAYMVGLNHEFARKLLWREYPTDQRGSYFRQFWDVRSVIDSEGLSQDALRQQLYDIPELHRWNKTSALGAHNNRDLLGEKGEQAVLVIRGELLKKYPTAVIYAHRAAWHFNANGTIDLTEPRHLVDLDPSEEDHPPPTKIRGPLYEAKADPDIYFFGFDLTIPEAKGGTGQQPTDDPGWFFVIKERPGEPRFGLDVSRSGPVEVFDELSWDDALPGGAPGDFLSATSLSSVALAALPPDDPEGKKPQRDDDEQIDPAAVSSARWAYLLFRPPVMVAIHADEMLGSGS